MEIIDNLLEDYTGNNTDNNGILSETSDGDYTCNYTFYFDKGMHYIGNNDDSRLLGNNFNYNQRDIVLGLSDFIGSSSGESWIGQQYEGNKGFGNIWPYMEGRVHNSATVEKVSWSEFRVNADIDERYMPEIVEAIDLNWFRNFPVFENMHPCDDDPGSDLPPKYNCTDMINKILMIDTMSNVSKCEKIVWMYKYYKKLVELKNKGLLIGDCLTFINTRQDSVMVKLSEISWTIDSIKVLQQNALSLLVELIELDEKLEELSDQDMEGTSEWDSVLAEYDQKTDEYRNALDDDRNADIIKLDSVKNVLNDVDVIDSCLNVLKQVYIIKLNLLKSDSITITEMQYLKDVADYCPDEYGDAVYLSRSILSYYDNDRYESMEECVSSRVFPRSDLNTIAIKKMQIYPNPARDNLKIFINTLQNEEGFVEIYDVKGKLFYKEKVTNDYNLLELNVKDYVSGVYFVKYTSDSNNISIEKLIINK